MLEDNLWFSQQKIVVRGIFSVVLTVFVIIGILEGNGCKFEFKTSNKEAFSKTANSNWSKKLSNRQFHPKSQRRSEVVRVRQLMFFCIAIFIWEKVGEFPRQF